MNVHQFLLMGIPAGVSLVGGILAAVWHPGRRARSLIQHFAAGVVLAALSVELLPEIERLHAPGIVLAGCFALGSLCMYGLKLITEKMEHAGAGLLFGVDRGLLLATFIDVAVDGFIIGAGFAAGGETGPVLAIGLSVELLFLGLALASEGPMQRWTSLGLGAALGANVLCAAVVGSSVLSGVSSTVLGGSLAFSAAALVYLVTEELLMEAHQEQEPRSAVLVLFGGFLAFWCVQLFGR